MLSYAAVGANSALPISTATSDSVSTIPSVPAPYTPYAPTLSVYAIPTTTPSPPHSLGKRKPPPGTVTPLYNNKGCPTPAGQPRDIIVLLDANQTCVNDIHITIYVIHVFAESRTLSLSHFRSTIDRGINNSTISNFNPHQLVCTLLPINQHIITVVPNTMGNRPPTHVKASFPAPCLHFKMITTIEVSIMAVTIPK